MGDKSGIEWTATVHADGTVTPGATWNPVTGCSKVSPGCAHCYAEALSLRWGWSKQPWTPEHAAENVVLHPDRLDLPTRWQGHKRIFVNSMSDLFHELVPDDFIDQVFAVMALSPRHTFQVLTKRPERMWRYLTRHMRRAAIQDAQANLVAFSGPFAGRWFPGSHQPRYHWPLPNVWLGTSVENQHWADVRVPLLLDTPAAVRFLSCEPLLGPVDLVRAVGNPTDEAWDEVNAEDEAQDSYGPDMEIEEAELENDWINYGRALVPNPAYAEYRRERLHRARFHTLKQGLQWVIAGGESGPHYRPMDLAWARSLRDQCQSADINFFFKQVGGRTPKAGGRELDGRTWDQFPEEGGA